MLLDAHNMFKQLPFWNWIVSCGTENEGVDFTVEVLDVLPELQVKPDRGGGDERR